MSIQRPSYGNRMTEVVEARPATLYHYTNAAGLLGIVEKRALWATDVQFLNDGEELIYAAREISAHARRRAEEICPELSHEPKYDDPFERAQRLLGIADGVDGHADGRYMRRFSSAAFAVTAICLANGGATAGMAVSPLDSTLETWRQAPRWSMDGSNGSGIGSKLSTN
jgi:hypothetical protein